jgi:hypothetical protein
MTHTALRRRIEDLAYRESQLAAQKYAGADWAAETAAILRCQRERAEMELDRLTSGARRSQSGPTLFDGVSA